MIKYNLKFKVHTSIYNLILSPDLQCFGKYYYLRNIFILYHLAKLFEEIRNSATNFQKLVITLPISYQKKYQIHEINLTKFINKFFCYFFQLNCKLHSLILIKFQLNSLFSDCFSLVLTFNSNSLLSSVQIVTLDLSKMIMLFWCFPYFKIMYMIFLNKIK